MNALLTGPELLPVREAMERDGCPRILEGGAKIFVWPHQYPMVLEELRNQDISALPSHVIVAESLLPQLEASIATIPSQKNVRKKNDGIFVVAHVPNAHQEQTTHGTEEGTEDEDVEEFEAWNHVLSVERTFICQPRVLSSAQSVTQSTAEVHGVRNHRRIPL